MDGNEGAEDVVPYAMVDNVAARAVHLSVRLFRCAWFGLAIVVGLGGCAAGSASTSVNAGTLVDLERADGATMNPLYAQTVQDGTVYATLLYDGLSRLGPDLAFHPDLAVSWRHSADGLHWDVDLRRGVRWSDGAPFTSKDVVFTYRIMRDPKTAFIGAGDLDYVMSVVADGPYRVHFTLAHASAKFVDAVLGEYMLPAHVLGAVPADRQAYTTFGEHPIGTGPYMLKRWQHDSEALFERNPYYWDGPAKIARIDFRIIFNDQAEVDAMENGSADLISDLGYHQSLRLAKESPQIKLLQFPSLYVDTAEVNLHRPGLDDVVVRQAMMYGNDREAIVRGFLDGKGAVADNLVAAALTRWYNPNVQKYPYDPVKARAMLDAAGWKVGPDGVRRRGTTRLEFDVLVNQGSVLILDEVLAFCADMREIGIKLNARQLDFPSLVQRAYSGKFDLIEDERGGVLDPDWTTVLLSTARPPNGANTTGYNDPIVDYDLKQGLRELDYTKRRALYNQMQVQLAKTLPMLWQYSAYSRAAYTPRLRLDPKTTLQAPLIWYNVADWKLTS